MRTLTTVIQIGMALAVFTIFYFLIKQEYRDYRNGFDTFLFGKAKAGGPETFISDRTLERLKREQER